MSTKKDDALKLALDWYDSGNENPDDFANMIKQVIALAQQQAQGCDYCTHPQYAGTKCKNCGREQPAHVAAINTSSERVENQAQNVHMQPAQQEPLGHGGRPMTLRECMEAEEPANANAGKPWVGLTQEDMYEIGEFKNTHGYVPTGFKRLAAAIEAKLREKNT